MTVRPKQLPDIKLFASPGACRPQLHGPTNPLSQIMNLNPARIITGFFVPKMEITNA